MSLHSQVLDEKNFNHTCLNENIFVVAIVEMSLLMQVIKAVAE